MYNGSYTDNVANEYLLGAEVNYRCDVKLPDGSDINRTVVCGNETWKEPPKCPKSELISLSTFKFVIFKKCSIIGSHNKVSE